jgi:hypothetical protein
MRYLFGLMAAGLATTFLWAAQGSGKVEVKGPHICCPQCVKGSYQNLPGSASCKPIHRIRSCPPHALN